MEKLNAAIALEKQLTTQKALSRPIKVIQFGEGNFLRAFVDWTIQQLNNHDLFDGNVAIVQPLPQGRVKDLEAQDRLYTVVLEGLLGGKEIRSRELIDSVGKTVAVYDDWEGFLALADNPEARVIVSNTTEAGIALDDSDTVTSTPPKSYPAKLAHLLKRRYDKHLPGFLIIPCELIANNGVALKHALVQTAKRFGWGDDFVAWLDEENTFVSTLVDRIVPGYPRDDAEALWNEVGYEDDNLVKAEPFYLWVVAGDEAAQRTVQEVLPAQKLGINLVTTDAVQPYRERKVYLLNGPHTTLAQVARLSGFRTVGSAMKDPVMRAFIKNEMQEEIIPVLSLPKEELETFAHQVVERFDNPFIEHSLDSIGLNSASKFAVRLLPLLKANAEQRGVLPPRIVLALASLLYIYGGFSSRAASSGEASLPEVAVQDSAEVAAQFAKAAGNESFVHDALAFDSVWGSDLNEIAGLQEAVEADFQEMRSHGIQALVERLAGPEGKSQREEE
ncbi:MAG: tagaturonate reductase [Bifidobacteriaceae bacterium]|jgi:tagaturonate reductase|nr:tagaturonate reductase [Bifidobacteriaceae bacterium]